LRQQEDKHDDHDHHRGGGHDDDDGHLVVRRSYLRGGDDHDGRERARLTRVGLELPGAREPGIDDRFRLHRSIG
jgi:hypothetical protein